MKIFSSLQKGIEKRINFYCNQLERAEEKESIEHMVQVGTMLSENATEISVYLAYKQGKSIPASEDTTTPVNPTTGG